MNIEFIWDTSVHETTLGAHIENAIKAFNNMKDACSLVSIVLRPDIHQGYWTILFQERKEEKP